MEDTIIYLIRNADLMIENKIRNTNKDIQIINEKNLKSQFVISSFFRIFL